MSNEQKQDKSFAPGVKGRVGIAGTFTFRDKDGNVVQTMEFVGSGPIDNFLPNSEQSNGTDNR